MEEEEEEEEEEELVVREKEEIYNVNTLNLRVFIILNTMEQSKKKFTVQVGCG